MARSAIPRAVRLPDQIDAALAALVARSGMTYTMAFETALALYLAEQSLIGESNLLDTLAQDFVAATLVLQVEGDEISVTASDVERRTTDPVGRPYNATQAPLEQFVGLEARPEPESRATVELVGLPGTDEAGVRVFVATLPAQPGASATVRLMDLHPISRGATDGDVDFEDVVSW